MSEFSRKYTLTAIGEVGKEFDLHATTEECMALAKFLDIFAVHRLQAQGQLSLIREGALAEGVFQADLEVACAGTGEPMCLRIEEPFSVHYVHHIKVQGGSGRDLEGHAAWTLNDLDEDMEELQGDVLDLGETIVQHVILAMPLAPKQNISDVTPQNEVHLQPHPFAALAALKEVSPNEEG